MKQIIQAYIDKLDLQLHPEGGFYRETYRSVQLVDVDLRGEGSLLSRNVCTGIHFLLEQGNFSAFHKIGSDEMWHFYAGQALEIIEIREAGELRCTRLGANFMGGDLHQYVVPAHTWFACRVAEGGHFSLVGCTVAPGFHFDDFHLADSEHLIARYPQHQEIIRDLTR